MDTQTLHVTPEEFARLRKMTEKYEVGLSGWNDIAVLEARVDEMLGKGTFAGLCGISTAVKVYHGGEPLPEKRITLNSPGDEPEASFDH